MARKAKVELSRAPTNPTFPFQTSSSYHHVFHDSARRMFYSGFSRNLKYLIERIPILCIVKKT